MFRPRHILVGSFVLLGVWSHSAASQQPSSHINAGTLTCDIDAGFALVIDSPRAVRCIFKKQNGGQETYRGRIRGGGLSIGVTARAVMTWSVRSETGWPKSGDLSGKYSGLEAGVAIGVGGSSRVLSGITNQAISLQPLALQPQAGLNIAIGVSQMELFATGVPQTPPASAEPTPILPEGTYVAAEPEPEPMPVQKRAPSYDCGSETRLQHSQTVSGLAQACGISLAALLEANPHITNVRTIQAGSRIRVPNGQAARKKGPCGRRTVVERGERLSDIAARCGISPQELAMMNPDAARGADLVSGQVLKVPQPVEAPAEKQVATVPTSETASSDQQSEPEPGDESGNDLESGQIIEAPESTEERRLATAAPSETASNDDQPGSQLDDEIAMEQRMGVDSVIEYPPLPGMPAEKSETAEPTDTVDQSLSLAELKEQCRDQASRQSGLPVDQIAFSTAILGEDDAFSVSMTAGLAEFVCLVDRQGRVLSLSQSERTPDQAPTDLGDRDGIQSELPKDEALIMIEVPEAGEARWTGIISENRSVAYGIRARANERVQITLESDQTNIDFNIVNAAIPYGEALLRGSSENGTQDIVTFPVDGIYLIRPYLPVTAAQTENEASYTLLLSRISTPAPTPSNKADMIDLAPSDKSDSLMPQN